ncbi:MAG TPA: pseudaminic acid synthase [Solidesulfovibrio magneticus]|nr:pseudaminic acid synthase [Solidesulfovibrio magneticus]
MSTKGRSIHIGGRAIGPGRPVYVIAEMSANHGGSFERAAAIVEAAARAGADAIKLQTYTPDTLTIDCASPLFRITDGPWEGRYLYDLYREAAMPWEWQPRLLELASSLGMDLFSTPFDETAVAFLEAMHVPAFKIASFELTDIALLRRVAATGKPVLLSTGMACREEIAEAVAVLRQGGCAEVALLKCTSAYPAPPEAMNVRRMARLAEEFSVPVGLSDHSLGPEAALAAVALGGCIIEKHFTLQENDGGPDAAFSLAPDAFASLVRAIRRMETVLGSGEPEAAPQEAGCKALRRSLFVVSDMRAGDVFTVANVRSIRPAHGLPTRYLDDVLGRRAACDIARGVPLRWDMVAGI